MQTQYLTAQQVRVRFGGISDMTLWRWLRDDRLAFPKPIVINGRRFFSCEQVENFERSRATAPPGA